MNGHIEELPLFIEELPLSVRARNALRSAGCKSVTDVRRLGRDGVQRRATKNCGKVTLEEIGAAIGGWSPPPPPPASLPPATQPVSLKRLSHEELLDHLSALAHVQAAMLTELANRMPELRRVAGAIHRVRSRS